MIEHCTITRLHTGPIKETAGRLVNHERILRLDLFASSSNNPISPSLVLSHFHERISDNSTNYAS